MPEEGRIVVALCSSLSNVKLRSRSRMQNRGFMANIDARMSWPKAYRRRLMARRIMSESEHASLNNNGRRRASKSYRHQEALYASKSTSACGAVIVSGKRSVI